MEFCISTPKYDKLVKKMLEKYEIEDGKEG